VVPPLSSLLLWTMRHCEERFRDEAIFCEIFKAILLRQARNDD
jgi:hypothetical protein